MSWKYRYSSGIWGIFFLMMAAFIVIGSFTDVRFAELGVWSWIVAGLAIIFTVQSIASLKLSALPFPLAILYYVFRYPLHGFFGWPEPEIGFWTLILAALLTTIGLSIIFPFKAFRVKAKYEFNTGGKKNKHSATVVDGDGGGIVVEDGGYDNNPTVSVHFGGINRYLKADALETVRLNCSFGSLEVFLDQVTLSPDGAEAFIDCSFGSVEMYVPKHWNVVDKLSCTIGGVEIKGHKHKNEDAPTLVLNGGVQFGSIEVRYV
jgi:predicted membrane protein